MKKSTIVNKIAIYYINHQFFIDLLAVFPFDLFASAFTDDQDIIIIFKLFGLFKLIRLSRLTNLIANLNISNFSKTLLRLVQLIMFIILFLHWLACLWFRIVKENRLWIPPLDYVYITTNLYEESSLYQYTNTFYHAVLMIGGNDIGPRNEFQFVFLSMILLAGAIINAIIFGNMAVMLQSLNIKSTKFQEILDNANEAMKNLKIPTELRQTVKYYLSHTYTASNHQIELDSFLTMLPPSLKQKVI